MQGLKEILVNSICPICNKHISIQDLKNKRRATLELMLKIPALHNTNCIKLYKFYQTHKKCTICGTYISKSSKFDECSKCREIKSRTYTCTYCGKQTVLTHRKSEFKHNFVCKECTEKYNPQFTIEFERQERIETEIKQLFQSKNIHVKFTDVIFDKLFNNTSINKNTDLYAWQKDKLKKTDKIINLYTEFILHIKKYMLKNHSWNIDDLHKFSNCLYRAFKQIDGYFINDFYSLNSEFSAILPGWKNKLNEKFDSFIDCLKTFTPSICPGPGEFMLAILHKQVVYNSIGKADILYSNGNLCEIKQGLTANKAGRLLFARENYIGYSKFNEYINALVEYFNNWLKSHSINYINLNEYLPKDINMISPANLTLNNDNNIFNWIINKIDAKCLKQEFMQEIFYFYTKNKMSNIRFFSEDLTDKENYKVFSIINYCLYYINVDAEDENLNELLFIGNSKILKLTKEFLTNCTFSAAKSVLKDWNISYPESEFTEKNKISHDRNKNRAPGVYQNRLI